MVQNQIIENTAIEIKTKLNTGIKKYTFDLISVGITLAIIAASLNALGFYDFTSENAWSELGSFFADWIPYFMAAILLNNNMYRIYRKDFYALRNSYRTITRLQKNVW